VDVPTEEDHALDARVVHPLVERVARRVEGGPGIEAAFGGEATAARQELEGRVRLGHAADPPVELRLPERSAAHR